MTHYAGLLSFDGGHPPVGALFTEALARLPADHRTELSMGAFLLAEATRATTPEAGAETGPVEWDGVIVTGDVRLDNRPVLLAALRAPEEATDRELVARAYRRWGRESPGFLLGDLTAWLWDKRQARLFGFRDPMGVRPAYVAVVPGRCYAFASMPGPLLALDGVAATIDERFLARAVDRDFRDRERTPYVGVRRLAPGSWCSVTADGVIRRGTFWGPPRVERRSCSFSESVPELRALLTEAVTCRLRSAAGVGAHLTGGLDSSTVAALAARARPGVATFFVDPSDDGSYGRREAPFVEAVTASCPVDHHRVGDGPRRPPTVGGPGSTARSRRGTTSMNSPESSA